MRRKAGPRPSWLMYAAGAGFLAGVAVTAAIRPVPPQPRPVAATIDLIEPLLAAPPRHGTLILRADLHGGLLELGDGILAQSLEHVLGRLQARRAVVLTTAASRHLADTAVGLTQPQLVALVCMLAGGAWLVFKRGAVTAPATRAA